MPSDKTTVRGVLIGILAVLTWCDWLEIVAGFGVGFLVLWALVDSDRAIRLLRLIAALLGFTWRE